MSESRSEAARREEAKNFAEFGAEMFTAALESMRDQLSDEEFEAMKQEGESKIAQFKKENRVE